RVRGPYRSLSIFEWIPGDADARLEVLVVLLIDVIEPVCADLEERACRRIEDHESVEAFRWRHVPVVTQPELERDIRTKLVVVLNVKAKCALFDSTGAIAQRDIEQRRI